jgi:hypothetical protein
MKDHASRVERLEQAARAANPLLGVLPPVVQVEYVDPETGAVEDGPVVDPMAAMLERANQRRKGRALR